MKREREWPYIDRHITKNKGLHYLYRSYKNLSGTYRLDKPFHFNSRISQILNKDSKLGSNIRIPSLKHLREIKNEKLLRIKLLVQSNCYDTPERQKETAKKVVNSLFVTD